MDPDLEKYLRIKLQEYNELVWFYQTCIEEQPEVHYWYEKQAEALYHIDMIMSEINIVENIS